MYKVQAGTFKDRENADDLVKKLKTKGYDSFVFKDTDGLFKVQAGAFKEKENADALAKELLADGFDTFAYKD